jgi:antitoxin VapB
MTLNIKDPKAHKLAQKLAQQTGETMTRAVMEALRRTRSAFPWCHEPVL